MVCFYSLVNQANSVQGYVPAERVKNTFLGKDEKKNYRLL